MIHLMDKILNKRKWKTLIPNNDYPKVLSQDIAANYVWLRPLVETFPQSVPGGVILTDVWLYLDKLLDFRLLVKRDDEEQKEQQQQRPITKQDKQQQAATEAERCKKLMGALRYLYRNSFSAQQYHRFWSCFGKNLGNHNSTKLHDYFERGYLMTLRPWKPPSPGFWVEAAIRTFASSQRFLFCTLKMIHFFASDIFLCGHPQEK